MAQRVVVIGASLGGLRAAESLRSSGYEGHLVVIGDEAHMPYNRPPLSKEALKGDLSHETVAFRVRSNAADVEWLLGSPAEAADLDERTVTTAAGDTLEFDGLVIATGLRPHRLPLDGPAGSEHGRHVLRTLDDARRLRGEIAPGSRVVVLGAGFIGCEVAATLTELGAHATCVAIDPLPMGLALGDLLAAEVQRRHEERGTVFRLSTGIDRLVGDDRVTGVALSSGEVIECDLVVEAVGSRCNVEWLDGNGLDLSNGVLTDNAMRVLDAFGEPMIGIHAVGDVARFPNPRFDDTPRRVEHWNMPTETARRAGPVLAAEMSGAGVDDVVANQFRPIPAFWSDQFDMRLQAYGMPALGGRHEILQGAIDGDVVVGYFDGDDLMGVTAIGMTKEVNAYRDQVGRA